MNEQLRQEIHGFRPLYETAERILRDVPAYDALTAYLDKTILFCGRLYKKDLISEHDRDTLRRIDAEFSRIRTIHPELNRVVQVGSEYPFLVENKFAN